MFKREACGRMGFALLVLNRIEHILIYKVKLSAFSHQHARRLALEQLEGFAINKLAFKWVPTARGASMVAPIASIPLSHDNLPFHT